MYLEGHALHWLYCRADKSPIGGWKSAAPGLDARPRTPGNGLAMIGVATGAINGIIAFDVDPRNGGDRTFAEEFSWLPATRTHRTGGGGQHLIYRYPQGGIGNFKGREGRSPGIEILSNGYGVAWPPSPGYTVIDDRPIVDCPERLVQLVMQAKTSPAPMQDWRRNGRLVQQPAAPGVRRDLPPDLYFRLLALVPVGDTVTNHDQRAVRGLLGVVAHAPEGERNTKLNWAAFRMRQYIKAGIVKREAAEVLLLEAASAYAADDGSLAAWRTIQSGLGCLD
jgi:hypothetical protein